MVQGNLKGILAAPNLPYKPPTPPKVYAWRDAGTLEIGGNAAQGRLSEAKSYRTKIEPAHSPMSRLVAVVKSLLWAEQYSKSGRLTSHLALVHRNKRFFNMRH